MHWYLWHLGTPERDMVAPFMDELVRRYPHAPVDVANGGARSYKSTYEHLVVNWLELAAVSEFIGRDRAFALARAQRLRSYGWLYDVVVRDWVELEQLYKRHGIAPIRTADELRKRNARARGKPGSKAQPRLSANGHAARPKPDLPRPALNGARRRTPAAARLPRSLLDPAVDLRRVVAGRLIEDARPVLDAAALGIRCAVIEPADARERDRRRAHGARLQRHVEIAAGEPLRAERRARRRGSPASRHARSDR